MTDTETIRGWMAADAIDCLHEWMRQTGDVEADSPLHRVRWMTDGTAQVEDEDEAGQVIAHHFRLTVLVESVDSWLQVSWAHIPELALAGTVSGHPVVVRIGDHEATVLSAVRQRWHVDPRSNEYRPEPLEHDVILVRLEGRNQSYQMPPDGPIEVRAAALGPAVANILNVFPGAVAEPPSRPIWSDPR